MLMKKLPLFGITLLAIGGAFTSCSKSTDVYNPDQPTVDDKITYEQAFYSYIGGLAHPQQDWGFNATKRADTRGTRFDGDGYYMADSYEKWYTEDFYKTALDSLPEKKAVGESIKNFEFISRGPFRFDIVFSYTDQPVEIGYYFYDPKTQTWNDRKEVKLVNNFVDDLATYSYFQYTTFSEPTEASSQWKTPTAWGGYNNIWQIYLAQWVHARMFTLRSGADGDKVDVPVGCRVGFYVKNPKKDGDVKVYTNKYLNKDETSFFAVLDASSGPLENAYVVGMEDRVTAENSDFDCNDIMLAVHKNVENTFPLLYIPEKPETGFRIIAEDLNVNKNSQGKEESDFDFNDIVLDVTLTNDGADCILQAAGGTLPIRINNDSELEVHKMFGVDQDVMVNTNADKKGLKNAKKDPVKFNLKGNFKSAHDIVIEVYRNDSWVKLYAPLGGAASKIVVGLDFVWTDERESLKGRYPNFPSYARDYKNPDNWWKVVSTRQ